MSHHNQGEIHIQQQGIAIDSTFNTYTTNTNTYQDRTLEYLRVTDPRDDKTRIEETKGGLFEDASSWILHHADFQQWRDGDGQLLWIKGDPGKGKTMLLCGIIGELEPSTKLKDENAPALLSYFFCQATDSRINNAKAVLRGLIYLLVKQQPSFFSHVQEKCKNAGKQLFKDQNAWAALCNIMTSILCDTNLQETYLVIDALDECLYDRDKLLNFILKHRSTRVKWLMSSRNNVDRHLQLDSLLILSLELDRNADSVSLAINAYIDDRTSHIKSPQTDPLLQNHVREVLRQKADGTFLWVALVVQELKRAKLWKVRRVVDEVPTGLDELYARMIEQIQRLGGLEPEYCRLVLSTATLAYRPLRLPELGAVSGLPDEISGEDEYILEVVETSGSFLTVRDKTIYFVHQSARDYLVDKAASTIFPFGPTAAHYVIFRQSLNSLRKSLRRDIYDLRHPGTLINEVKVPVPDPLAAVRYSCLYWINHLLEARHRADFRDAVRDNSDVHDFLQRYLLYWIEALSLYGAISNGVLVIAKLERLLKTATSDSGLLSAAQDVHRFLLYNGFIVKNAPLQIYTSALLFAPTASLTRQLPICQKEEPKWVTIRPMPHTDWSPLVQTLAGHTDSVSAVAFSPDGQLVASASDDNTVKLWHAGTGEKKQTLIGHTNSVWAVAFSPDGQLVASASVDHSVKLWHAGTGEKKQTLTGHNGSVRAVAFSPDGQLVASASSDNIVNLWYAGTGEKKQTLIGHTFLVNAVAFSPDGQLVASASNDNTVMLWHASTGKKPQTLKGHTGSVLAVAFSPNGQVIASASRDKTVKLWHVNTGEEKQTLTGHTFWVHTVVFSPDGQFVASASNDNTVMLWHAGTGRKTQTLKGHTGSVLAVAFSPNGQVVASASRDKTVKLWHVGTGEEKQTLTGHTGWVRAVVFSPDGQLLASASEDHTVKLWHAGIGGKKQAQMGHKAWVNAFAFSPDGQLVASASGDDTVKLWYASTGEEIQTLTGHTSSVWAVAFSPDGQLVASASHDKTVKLWNAGTGDEIYTFPGHNGSVRAVAFSPDGQLVASASGDDTVKLWHAGTGEEKHSLTGHTSSVFAVAFSPDGQLVASASGDNTVKLWQTGTGELQQTLPGNRFIRTIEFDVSTPSLLTNTGRISLGSAFPAAAQNSEVADAAAAGATTQRRREQQLKQKPYGLDGDGSWITYYGERLLWLPHEFQQSSWAAWGSKIAIGCVSGRVLLFKFGDVDRTLRI